MHTDFKQPQEWLMEGWASIAPENRRGHIAAIQANAMNEAARLVEEAYHKCFATERLADVAERLKQEAYIPTPLTLRANS